MLYISLNLLLLILLLLDSFLLLLNVLTRMHLNCWFKPNKNSKEVMFTHRLAIEKSNEI